MEPIQAKEIILAMGCRERSRGALNLQIYINDMHGIRYTMPSLCHVGHSVRIRFR